MSYGLLNIIFEKYIFDDQNEILNAKNDKIWIFKKLQFSPLIITQIYFVIWYDDALGLRACLYSPRQVFMIIILSGNSSPIYCHLLMCYITESLRTSWAKNRSKQAMALINSFLQRKLRVLSLRICEMEPKRNAKRKTILVQDFN